MVGQCMITQDDTARMYTRTATHPINDLGMRHDALQVGVCATKITKPFDALSQASQRTPGKKCLSYDGPPWATFLWAIFEETHVPAGRLAAAAGEIPVASRRLS